MPQTTDVLPLSQDDLDLIDTILDDLRTRFDETPQWEFCEGFMAALVVCRRAIPSDEYFAVLLDRDVEPESASAAEQKSDSLFADAAQEARFMELWRRRWAEIAANLDAEVESLNDAQAYHPVVLDVRGAVAALPEEERSAMAGEELPSFAQVWAIGFMYAVENWPEEWTSPRDKQARKALDAALQSMVALTEDDTDPPTLAVFDEDSVPSVSQRRFDQFGEAIWGIYELRGLWKSLGPRVETVVRSAEPGRNDPCHCGSGKKYKKCHGA